MRKAAVASIFGALLVIAPVAAQSDVEFEVPAQAGSFFNVNATWMFASLDRGAPLIGQLDSEGPALQQNITHMVLGRASVGNVFGDSGHEVPTSEESSLAPFQARLEHTDPGKASIQLQGAQLSIQVEADTAEIIALRETDCAAELTGSEGIPQQNARYHQLCPRLNGAALAFRQVDDTPIRVSLKASSWKETEFHNLLSACPSAACPSSSYRENQTTAANGVSVANGRHTFTRLQTDFGSDVSFDLESNLLVIGSEALDIQVDGWVKLPRISLPPSCQTCVMDADSTLSATGLIKLENIHPNSQGRMTATLGGDIASLRFNEESVDPSLLTGATATVAAATAAGLVLLKLLLAPLFTRRSKEEALEHPNRKAIYEHIQRNPGTSFRETARILGMAAGTVRHHLNVLQRSDLVVERAHGSTVRFFEKKDEGIDWVTVVMLREPSLKILYDWLKGHPKSPQSAILEAMEVHGWSRSTTQHRLARLVDSGLVTIKLQGRYKIYSLADRSNLDGDGRPNPVAPTHNA